MIKSEEKSMRELFLEVNSRLARELACGPQEVDSLKYKMFKRMRNELMVKIREIESFKYDLKKGFDYDNEKEISNMFTSFNSVVFAGFDYYYLNDIGELLLNRQPLDQEGNLISVLINEEHMEKLRSTIDCTEDFSYYNFEDENGNVKNVIRYKNTLLGFDLIPFVREKDGSITVKGEEQKSFNIPKTKIKDLFKLKNSEYNDLEYKTLSKHGARLFK